MKALARGHAEDSAEGFTERERVEVQQSQGGIDLRHGPLHSCTHLSRALDWCLEVEKRRHSLGQLAGLGVRGCLVQQQHH